MRKHWFELSMGAALLVFAVAGMIVACTPGEKALVQTAVDVSNAVCQQLEQQDPNDPYIQFACTVTDVAGKVTPFLAKVKREDAATFAARRCPQKGFPAP